MPGPAEPLTALTPTAAASPPEGVQERWAPEPLDPYAEAFQQRPHAAYAALRRTAPVHPVEGCGWWVVTTMDLVREVLRDPSTYSSLVGHRTEPPPEVRADVERLRASGIPRLPTLLSNDPPDHTRIRRLCNRAFTPRALRAMEPDVRATARALAGALPDGEVVDLVERFAVPLPVGAISRILGLGPERCDDVRRWSDAAIGALGGRLEPARWLDVEQTMLDFQQAMVVELEQRRDRPREDLLSVLASADPDHGDRLDDDVLVNLLRELLVAGNETTTRLIAESVVHTAGEPWERLAAAPEGVPLVVEETLRLLAPTQGMFRRVTRDVELGGVALPEGSVLFLSYSSANRDEAVFAQPDAFRPDRQEIRSHVSFGHGIHACIGAGLARLEARVALEELTSCVRSVTVVEPGSLRYLPSFLLRGLTSLPVRITRR